MFKSAKVDRFMKLETNSRGMSSLFSIELISSKIKSSSIFKLFSFDKIVSFSSLEVFQKKENQRKTFLQFGCQKNLDV